MRQVGVLQAKTEFSALVSSVETGGETVLITRHGRPVAKLSAATGDSVRPSRRLTGAELVERVERLQDLIAREYPAINALTQDDWRRMGRE